MIYDDVMSHVDYDLWSDYIVRILDRHGASIKDIVDISCGTGSQCLRLAKRNFSVAGCDLSYPMLQKARRKALSANYGVSFWRGNMKDLALKRQNADLILSLYDSMNYLMDENEWRKCFQDVYLALRNGGYYIFDVSTVHNSVHVFGNYNHRETLYNAIYHRKSRFHEKTMIQETYFEIRLKEEPNVIFCERHQQRIRRLAEIEQLIRESPLELVAHYDGFSFDAGTEDSERVHFVLQKRG